MRNGIGRLLLLVAVISAGWGARGGLQKVSVSWKWLAGDVTTTAIDGNEVDPVSAYVPDGQSVTFTAQPPLGQKAVAWYQNLANPPTRVENFLPLDEGDTYTWENDEGSTEAAILGLELDYITYRLQYDTLQSVDLTYTNQHPIADCPTTRAGYTFAAAWTNVAGTVFATGSVVTGESFALTNHDDEAVVTMYPKWSANQYDVSLDQQSGGGGTASVTMTYDAMPPDITVPTRTGYAFRGYTNEVGKLYYDADGKGESVWQETDVDTLYARWVRQCLVTWQDASQFDFKVLKTEFVDVGGKSLPPTQPTHDGYTFTGWTGTGESIYSETTITAQYQANAYSVVLHPNGGTGSSSTNDYVYGQSGSLPANPFTRTGYAFVGWGTNTTEAVIGDKAQVLNWATKGSVDLYAIWSANAFTVVYRTEKGTGTMDDQHFVYDVSQQLSSNRFVNGELPFLRWKCSNGRTYSDGELVSNLTAVANGIVTNTAVWAGTYRVRFNANGGQGEMANQTFDGADDEKPLASNAFVRTGYEFQGWGRTRQDADERKALIGDGATVKNLAEPGETADLYASWKPVTYCVAFTTDVRGVILQDPPVLTCVYDQSVLLPDYADFFRARDPDLDTFAAWRDDVNGVTYANAATVSNLCTTAGTTNVLTATWKLDVGEWSEHLHCTTLKWSLAHDGLGGPAWEQKDGETWGYEQSGKCVRQEGGSWNAKNWMQATVKTNGVLKFYAKWDSNSGASQMKLNVGLTDAPDAGDFNNTQKYSGTTLAHTSVVCSVSGEWISASVPIRIRDGDDQAVVRLAVITATQGDYVEIDQMVWTPEGGGAEPQPGVDNPTVTGIAFEGGKLVIRSTGDAKFGYQVLSTLSLEPADWQVEGESYQAGQGEGQRFELTVDPADPQKFYKVEVLRKK